MSVSILVASGHVYARRSGVCVCRVRVHAWCAPPIAAHNARSRCPVAAKKISAGYRCSITLGVLSIAIFSFDANTM